MYNVNNIHFKFYVEVNKMDEIEKIKNVHDEILNKNNSIDTELGLILWKLESLEEFYPCYKTMIKKD